MARAVTDVAAPLGHLDVLINNAAVAIDRRQPAAAPDFDTKVHIPSTGC
ncbi:hypothetical protein [Kitasatospora sp. NPDC088346]